MSRVDPADGLPDERSCGPRTNYGGFFNGTIDEVSVYTTTMSQPVVTSH